MVEIPEFHGGSRGEALLDWLATVDELLDFKQVPEERLVPLVAMKFRGHADSWWKQVKTTRHRKKHLKATFLSHNYECTMYKNLRQGSYSVDEYADNFPFY